MSKSLDDFSSWTEEEFNTFFTDPLQAADPEMTGGERTLFGHLRLYVRDVARSFVAGSFITIPGVVGSTGGQFAKEKDEAGNLKFGGLVPGNEMKLFVLVATLTDKDGNDYQVVKSYRSKTDKKDFDAAIGGVWHKFTWPAMLKLTPKTRLVMAQTGLYAKWLENIVGQSELTDKATNETKKVDIKAWVDFEVFNSKAEMQQARDGFFSRVTAPAVDNGIWPLQWKSDPQAMIDWVKTAVAAGATHISVVADGLITGPAINGQVVNPRQVLAKILDIP